MESNTMLDITNKVSKITIIGNIILSGFKLIAGLVGSSSAIISDAVHSASDVASTIVVMIGVTLASKDSDDEHPYGHERMECIAAILLAVMLFITGCGIGVGAINTLITGNYIDAETPGVIALVAAISSIVIKELMFWYTIANAKKINSSALMADAWHHRSDALSSVGALIGISGARLGFPIMDTLASLVIFIFICKAAFDIFKDAVDKLVDKSCDKLMQKKIYDHIIENEDVTKIDDLRTRLFGNKVYVDIEIAVDGNYSLRRSHEIAENIHDDIEENFPEVKHIMVHVNPV